MIVLFDKQILRLHFTSPVLFTLYARAPVGFGVHTFRDRYLRCALISAFTIFMFLCFIWITPWDAGICETRRFGRDLLIFSCFAVETAHTILGLLVGRKGKHCIRYRQGVGLLYSLRSRARDAQTRFQVGPDIGFAELCSSVMFLGATAWRVVASVRIDDWGNLAVAQKCCEGENTKTPLLSFQSSSAQLRFP